MFIKLAITCLMLCAFSFARFVVMFNYDDSCDRKYHLRDCIILCFILCLAFLAFGYLGLTIG